MWTTTGNVCIINFRVDIWPGPMSFSAENTNRNRERDTLTIGGAANFRFYHSTAAAFYYQIPKFTTFAGG